MKTYRVLLSSLSILFLAANAQAADLSGRVVDGDGRAVPGVTVEVSFGETTRTVSTGGDGEFTVSELPNRTLKVEAAAHGFDSASTTARPGELVELVLQVAGFSQKMVVTAALPDMATEVAVPARALDEQAAKDVAGYLRQQPGVSSFRRGSVNLEPTIRGLHENQVGMFVDGTRTFAAGPARMDSDISHVSPRVIQGVSIVKGPYALTWGAGTLSAIEVETRRPAFAAEGSEFKARGRIGYNFAENGDNSDFHVASWGGDDRLRYVIAHNVRNGDDYEDGDGTTVQGDYESYDTRYRIGGAIGDGVEIDYTGGFQEQRDLDYPGRVLNAELFRTWSHAVELKYRGSGRVTDVQAQVYANLKDHAMTNDDKPTAAAAPGRVPPFGLDISLPTESDTYGARFNLGFGSDEWRGRAGLDMYQSEQTARRFIRRRSNGKLLFNDIVWPDGEIRDIGIFAQGIHDAGEMTFGGTVRLDFVGADAGEVSEFFAANTTGDVEQNETNVSAAFSSSFRFDGGFSLSAGLGTAVRTATVMERYSDRFPATRFQSPAEFMGNPGLDPERSTELDVGLTWAAASSMLRGDVFYRTMDDYITVAVDPTLQKRLPLSPPTVYRYINGDGANFYGVELFGEQTVNDYIDINGVFSYTRGEDETFDEPAFGVAPLEGRLSFHVHTADRRSWAELQLTAAADQDRVATARLERPTDSWTRLDIRAGVSMPHNLDLRVGVHNLTDESYAEHLNALNPFNGKRINEPGTSVYVGIEYGF